MKAADLRAMTVDQLDDEALKLKKERFNLRFRSATEAIDNPMRFRTIRRDIARLETVLRQRAAQAR